MVQKVCLLYQTYFIKKRQSYLDKYYKSKDFKCLYEWNKKHTFCIFLLFIPVYPARKGSVIRAKELSSFSFTNLSSIPQPIYFFKVIWWCYLWSPKFHPPFLLPTVFPLLVVALYFLVQFVQHKIVSVIPNRQ